MDSKSKETEMVLSKETPLLESTISMYEDEPLLYTKFAHNCFFPFESLFVFSPTTYGHVASISSSREIMHEMFFLSVGLMVISISIYLIYMCVCMRAHMYEF